MSQFPINQNTPNGQTHTVMESPLWIGRLYSFWAVLIFTFIVMLPVPFILPNSWKSFAGFIHLFQFGLPFIIAIFLDELFMQPFLKPDLENSNSLNHITIRGIPIPKIRDWMEWHLKWRKVIILTASSLYIVLTIFSSDFDFVFGIFLLEIFMIIFGSLIKTWHGFKRFNFMSWYITNVSTFKTYK